MKAVISVIGKDTLGIIHKVSAKPILVLCIEHKWRHHNDLRVCLFLDQPQDGSVIQRELLVCGEDVILAVPDIIDTDEEGDDIGPERDAVCVDAVKKLICAISADTEIDKLKVYLGMLLCEYLGGVLGIAGAHVVIISLISSGIGYAVALKKELYLLICHFSQ